MFCERKEKSNRSRELVSTHNPTIVFILFIASTEPLSNLPRREGRLQPTQSFEEKSSLGCSYDAWPFVRIQVRQPWQSTVEITSDKIERAIRNKMQLARSCQHTRRTESTASMLPERQKQTEQGLRKQKDGADQRPPYFVQYQAHTRKVNPHATRAETACTAHRVLPLLYRSLAYRTVVRCILHNVLMPAVIAGQSDTAGAHTPSFIPVGCRPHPATRRSMKLTCARK